MLLEIPSGNSLIESANNKELRAGERVLQYLLAEFERPGFKGGSRLPTNKELAQRLNVSPGTVQTVLRKLAQEGRIRSQRGSGTFFMADPVVQASRTLRIGIGAPLQKLHDEDGWISRIGGGLFQAALKRQAVLEGVSTRDSSPEGMIAELMEKKARLDALILLPYTPATNHSVLIESYESAGKPVVHIHPPTITATANFTSTGFFGASFAIGKAWRETGRRRVIILTNFCQPAGPAVTVSDRLRHAGLASGLGMQNSPSLSSCESINHGQTQEAGYKAIKQLLSDGGALPDAIYCSGDWLALGAFQAFQEAGIQMPNDVSIIGASGMNLAHTICPELTRVRSELEVVGQEAVEMVVKRIQLAGISLPGIVVPATFIGGGTTRAEENVILEIDRPPEGRATSW